MPLLKISVAKCLKRKLCGGNELLRSLEKDVVFGNHFHFSLFSVRWIIISEERLKMCFSFS